MIVIGIGITGTSMWGGFTFSLNSQHSEKNIIDTITYLGNNTYQAGVQCTIEVLQNITFQCNITEYQTKIKCQEFPSKKKFTELIFKCDNLEFINFLQSNTGGYKKLENEGQDVGGIILATFGIIMGILTLIFIILPIIYLIRVIKEKYEYYP